MKLHTERAEVERSNIAAETEFRIKTSACAFNILSSGIYTDNILAVIRELCCNAYDAHVAAGKKNVPFEVHLPNKLEPWFHVRDEGTGLSDEQVMSLYTTYFDSTKTDSNDYIGALGLGSKSPFSYTSSFEVISRYNGMRRMYSVFINEDGIPTIAKLGEIATDEPNGLEVKVTVQEKDFWTFQTKTSTALQWFKVRPSVIGYPGFTFPEVPQEQLRGENWILLPRGSMYGSFTAVQGNVAYRVDLSHLNLSSEVKTVLSSAHLVAFFEIGELEVAASREEIRYDNRSKEALTIRIESFCDEMVKEIESQIKPVARCFWSAVVELNNISRKTFGTESGLREFLNGRSTNKTIQRYCAQDGHLIVPTTHAHELFTYSLSSSRTSYSLTRKRIENVVIPKGDMAVFVNDVKVGGVARLKEFINTTKFNSVVVIRKIKNPKKLVEDKDGNIQTHTMTEKECLLEYAEIVKGLGDPDIKLVSTDAPKVERSDVDRTIPVYKYGKLARVGKYGYDKRVDWERLDSNEFEYESGGLYFLLRNTTNIIISSDKGDIKVDWAADKVRQNFLTLIALVNKHFPDLGEFTFEDLYGVGAQSLKKVEKLDNWYNIFDLIQEILPEYQDAVSFTVRRMATPDILGIKRCLGNQLLLDMVSKLDTSSAFRKVVEPVIIEHNKFADLENVVATLYQFDRKYGKNIYAKLPADQLFNESNFSKYPLLQLITGDWISATNIDHVFDYINLVDRSTT